jgi:hypothetical protein
VAFYKSAAAAQGANIVRREYGLAETYVPCADPRLMQDVVPATFEEVGSNGVHQGASSVRSLSNAGTQPPVFAAPTDSGSRSHSQAQRFSQILRERH